MSSASSAVTYTSIYTDSELRRVFWGADEELSDNGPPRVIIYGYDGLPMQPVAPPSSDYIPDPEEPQTPPVPQDEDEREPMFIQPHDPDYVPNPMYPEYIPLEDKHVFPAEEQPLPHVVSPTAESPGYVVESDPEEDPEEYEDDETEDGPVDYPIDGGEDGDDDDGDSHGDDADDEDEDEDEEEEEEHLALADSAVVVPTVELVSPPEGTEHVTPPPSTDITTTGARINVWLQASTSLPPEAEVERLLAMPTPPPSPLISLSPPSARERLARVTELAELHEHDTQNLYALLEDAQDSRTRISQRVTMDSQRVDLLMEDRIAHQETAVIMSLDTREQVYASSPSSCLSKQLQFKVLDFDTAPGDMRLAPRCSRLRWQSFERLTAELLALREQQRKARQPGPDVRVPDHQDASRDADSHIYQIRTLVPDAYSMTWEVLKKKMTDKYCPQGEIKKLEIELWNLKVKGNDVPTYTERFQELTLICVKFVANETEKVDKYISGLLDNIYGNVKSSRPKTLDETIKLANDLMDQKLRHPMRKERQTDNKKKADDSSRNNHGHQQQPFKRQNVAKVYNMGSGEKKPYGGSLPKCTKCHFHHNGPCTQKCHKCNKVGHFSRDCRGSGNTNVANAQRDNRAVPKRNGCFKCGAPGHFKRDCPKLKNKDWGNKNAQGWVYAVGNAEKIGNALRNPDSNVVTGTFLLNKRYASILFDTDADRSFISTAFNSRIDIAPTPLENKLGCFDVIIFGMGLVRGVTRDRLCDEKLVRIPYRNETLIFRGNESNNGKESRLTIILCSKAQEYMVKGCQIFLAQISAKKEEDKSEGKQLKDVPIVWIFRSVFPRTCLASPARPVGNPDRLIPGIRTLARAPYRLALSEMKELSKQLQDLSDKGFIRPSSPP
ncbi:putative reverse transcriptase domain-containing protein [Tanacetum coccineum]